jgi:anti-anti-sigma factor
MTTTSDRRERAGERRIAFVKLPEAIDVTNDCIVLDDLVAALADGPSVLVADGTETGFCDCAGVSALVCAHRQAAAAGAQLRLVTPSVPLRRIIKLTGAHNVLGMYFSMDDALADMTGPQLHASSVAPARTGETQAEPDEHSRQPDH